MSVNQPEHEMHQRWPRGCRPEKISGSCVSEGLSSHEIENAPQDAQGQVPQHGKLQLPPRPGEIAHETRSDAVECKYNIADKLRPEEEPPDA